MSMRVCQKCLDNNWKLVLVDGFILATCQGCGNEVEFQARTKDNKQPARFMVGDPCRKCGYKLILKQAKITKKKLAKTNYHYSAFHYCLKCKTFYYSDDFKVYHK